MRRCVGVVAGAALVLGSILGLVPAAVSSAATAGTVSQFAGTGTAGFGGNGGAATAALFSNPSDEAVSPTTGDAYIADFKNCQVRRVAPNGTISAFAGTGGPANCATTQQLSYGGQATATQIGQPSGVAVDAAGNVYIANCTSYFNQCFQGNVAKVAPNGVISNFAGNGVVGSNGDGNQATAAEVGTPWGIRTDSAGNVYFSDTTYNVVREVNTLGVITTVAGTPSTTPGYSGDGKAATAATLSDPTGLYIDTSGNLFIADTNNFVVREVSGGIISTFAGNGTPATSGDNGLATLASLQKPFGVVEDTSGNVYIADYTASCVREVSGGIITTFGGTCGTATSTGNGGPIGSATFNGPSQVVFDYAGNLLVNEYEGQQVRLVAGVETPVKLTPSTPTVSNLPASPVVGSSFKATVSTSGDGTKSVHSNSPNTCAVGSDGLTVSFVGSGACSLTALVSAGVTFQAGTGAPQVTAVGKGTPSTPLISNIPVPALVGHVLAAAVSTNSDGVTSVTSNSTAVCTVAADGLTVDFVAPGTCSLTAKVAASANYLAGSGTAQSFAVNPVTSPGSATQGYWIVATDGGIFNYGDAGFYGSAGAVHLNQPIVGMASTPDGKGYWLVARDGGIFNYGDAGFYGSAGGIHLNKPIVGMAATPDGKGYWLVARDGGIFNYGDAGFFGSAGAVHLNQPIVGMAASPTAKGYWLVASDGGIFNYGDAAFFGSAGGVHLNRPVVGLAVSPDGKGYWMVATDGGIFNYGDAGFFGSTGSIHLNSPIWGMAATPDGKGYWLVATDGGIFTYGDATFHGSAGSVHLNQPVIGIAPGP